MMFPVDQIEEKEELSHSLFSSGLIGILMFGFSHQ